MFFLLLFAVNSFLVVISRQGLPVLLADIFLPDSDGHRVSSAFPGIVARDFQKKEADYNRYLQQVQSQRQRGWRVNKGWLARPIAGQAETFRVEVHEKNGDAVLFAKVGGVFQRPSDSLLDQDFTLQEVESGVYQVKMVLPKPGRWNLWLRIHRGEQSHEVLASTAVYEQE